MGSFRRYLRQNQARNIIQVLKIIFSNIISSFIPIVEVFKLDPQKGSLQGIQPRIVALYFVIIFFFDP